MTSWIANYYEVWFWRQGYQASAVVVGRIEEWFALLAILGTTSAGEMQRQDDITHVNREGGRIKWVGGDTDATLYKAAD